MYARVLVPLEHSAYDRCILDHVRTLARFCRSSIVLIHVADGWVARNQRHLQLRESEEMRDDRAYLERICAELTADGFDADCVLASGDPPAEIAAAAEREACDLIAMATHGHKFLADLIHGSVADAVRHRSMVPVLLVRGPVGVGDERERTSRMADLRQTARGHRGVEISLSPVAVCLGPPVAAFSRPKEPRPAMTPTHKNSESLTAPVEDYLKAVYEIERSGSAAATTTLAARLGVAPASVSGMVRRLAEQGLLAYEPYRGVTLTASGRTAALRTLRRHRVLESYLATVLGYPWDRVHEEAERLEHAASDELVDRMAQALGDPAVDPHGAPIPTREGRVDETVHATLAEMDVGARARVVRVSDADGAMLRYLAELGILPGTSGAVVTREPYGGPIGVEVDGVQRSVGPALAEQVLVEEEP